MKVLRLILSSVISLSDKCEPLLRRISLMDSWLESEGYYRKHIARDASSLFRCVSEVVFLTQAHHLIVRRHCVQFAKYQTDIFATLTHISVQEYVERLSNLRERGTTLDMQIMSLIYKLEFAVFKEIMEPWEKITFNGNKLCIFLSLSHDYHYDSVYPRAHITNTAICQSVLYEIIYKQVFKLEEVDYAVKKMLHDKNARYQTELNVTVFSAGYQMRLEMRDNCRNVKQLLNYGITPFPYKVAKSLDPNIYRNVEHDTWNEQKRGQRHMSTVWNNNELQVGSRCIVNFYENDQKIKRHGYIQEMSPNKGPVVIYVEEFGEKQTVPYERLELISNNNESDDEDEFFEQLSEFNVKEEPIDVNNKKDDMINEAYDIPPNNGARESCSVQYIHPSTSTTPGYINTQNYYSYVSSMKPGTTGVFHNNVSTESHDGQQKITVIDNSPISYAPYSQVLYPTIITPDLNVPPPVLSSSLGNTKPQPTEEYHDNSSMRCGYNNNFDPYYGYGYSTYPYCVLSTGVMYPVQPGISLQSSTDATRVTYSYPMPQMTNELLYALPMPSSNNKNEISVYPVQGMYPSSVKKSTQHNTKADVHVKETNATNLPPSQPLISPNVYPIAYPSYNPPYCYSYDYCRSCPDVQRCERLTPAYHQVPQMLPIAYSEDMYSNTQAYCQPLLPVNLN